MDKLLYNKDVLVARIDSLNHFTWINKSLAPLYLQNSENFVGWLENRCIDTHRPNSRLLRRALRLEALEDSDLALEVNAATITDTYWVKDADSPLKWCDVQFKKAEYSSLALIGGYDNFQKAATSSNKKTQELTNSGSFEKCWRVRDGSWWLYKQATSNQLFQNYSHISSVKNWVSIWLSIELVPDILNKAFAISVAKILQREQNTILNQ